MNKEDFAARMDAMLGILYGVTRTYLQIPADCADAVQESALKAWRGLPLLRNEDHFETWVVRILINECKAILRKGKRIVLVAELPVTGVPHGAEPEIYEAIYALDIRYRAPFVLYHVEGYSVQEISTMLRLPKGTVTSRLQRARKTLRQVYGGDLG